MEKIFILSNDDITCRIYRLLLHLEGGYTIIGYEKDIAKALNYLSTIESAPDIIFIDFKMSNRDALSLLQSITQKYPDLKIMWINPDKKIKDLASEFKSLYLIEELYKNQDLIFFIRDASKMDKNGLKISS